MKSNNQFPTLKFRQSDNIYYTWKCFLLWLFLVVIFSLLFGIIIYFIITKDPVPVWVGPVNLPADITPYFYKLTLQIFLSYNDASNLNVRGWVEIAINCTNETNKIYFHGSKLKFDLNYVTLFKVYSQNDWKSMRKKSLNFDPDREVWMLETVNKLSPKYNYRLLIDNFHSKIDRGLYLYDYKTRFGQERFGLYSQPPARSIFPCMDDGRFRADFNFTLIRSVTLRAISTTKLIVSRNRGNGLMEDHFDTIHHSTPDQLAVVLCDLQYSQMVTSHNIPIRYFFRPSMFGKISAFMTSSMNKVVYLAENGQSTKLDLVFVPGVANGFFNRSTYTGLMIFGENDIL